MKIYPLFSFLFLFACVSSDKVDYDSLEESQFERESQLKRNVAYLKQISQFKEDNFQFISKQMKDMIQNYERMKQQLEKIESKLDRSLLKKTSIEKEPLQPQIERNEDSIVLTKKNKEQVVVFLSSIEDYTKLLAQILRGEYDISEEEKEKLLFSVRKRMDEKKKEELESTEEIEFFEMEDIEELDEDLLPENRNETGDFFQEENSSQEEEKESEENSWGRGVLGQKAQEEKRESKENNTFLISAKKHFEEKSYETAISEFQKYRNENPEGVYYPEATFYIGQAFENLKMPIEAEVFFKEIVQSHPQSLWAGRAKKFLKK
ncbi:MAG: hypothetical protein OXJ52_01950 [Oligoflexia bacterium]|nr:hypothetical protein [Oligoflexia bacterium]